MFSCEKSLDIHVNLFVDEWTTVLVVDEVFGKCQTRRFAAFLCFN